jgi:hypothetical protein
MLWLSPAAAGDQSPPGATVESVVAIGRGVRAPAIILILLEGGKPSVDVFARLILRQTISLLQPTF